MLSQRQFERYQMSRYLAEARLLHLWEEAKRNIGEYWFGIPAVPKVKVIWELPKCLYPMTRVVSFWGNDALSLKSIPKVTDDLQMVSLTDEWIYRHIHTKEP